MIRISHTDFPAVALTHPGMTGKNNEDRFAVSAYQLKPGEPTPVLLVVLADGIGGHRAGEVAAGVAVDQVSRQVAASEGNFLPPQVLHQAFIQASQQIFALAQSEEGRRGMGSTCTTAWIIGDRLYTATVGDSRLYLMREGAIRQLSTDHTWIQEAILHGIVKPEEARGHPNAHVIRRYLGSPQPPEVDFRLRLTGLENDAQAEANQGMRLQIGDRILLCSDGLTDLVNDDEILAAYQNQPMDAATNYLIQLACQRGGHDNITIVVVEVPPQVVARKPARRRWWLPLLVVLLVAAVIVAGVFAWTQRSTPGDGTPTPTPALVVTVTQAGGEVLPTPQPAQPTLSPSPRPTATHTVPPATPGIPQQGGATLTPWPTNTPKP
ncbi:MAG TPA: protein phosphatase 2C domain-containing protein [Anaerolineaceae bacterium]|nr:protein phosphatase 2C domain-containing protein [Anaerolineaceae bacterium]